MAFGRYTLSILLFPILFIISLKTGSTSFSWIDIWDSLVGSQDTTLHSIFWNFRLPRSLSAIAAGSALAVAGLQLQSWFRNPLAGPFVLGISSGSSLGVALLLLAFPTGFWFGGGSVFAAIAGAMVMLVFLLRLNRRLGSRLHLLIAGLMISYLCGAAINILTYYSSAESIRLYVLWTLGSFASTSLEPSLVFLSCTFLILLFSFFWAKDLDHLLLGEDYALSTGLNLKKAGLRILLFSSLLAALATAYCGPIGFIGLAVPHLTRFTCGHINHRILTPMCALWGANICLLANILCQIPRNGLPLNALTSLVGAPFVLYLLWKRSK